MCLPLPKISTFLFGCSIENGTWFILWLNTTLSIWNLFTNLITGNVLLVFYYAFQLFISCSGKYGVAKSKSLFLLPMVILACVYALILMILCPVVLVIPMIVVAFMSITRQSEFDSFLQKHPILVIFISEIIILCAFALQFYFIVVLYNYYKRMRAQENSNRRSKTDRADTDEENKV